MLNTTFSGFYKNSFIDLFYKQVNTNPSSIAVVAEDSKITYDELNKRSNKLARFLKKNGVKNGVKKPLKNNTKMIVQLVNK